MVEMESHICRCPHQRFWPTHITDGQNKKNTDTHTDRQTDRQTNKHTDRQTHRQTDRQTNRQTDRQTDNKIVGRPGYSGPGVTW